MRSICPIPVVSISILTTTLGQISPQALLKFEYLLVFLLALKEIIWPSVVKNVYALNLPHTCSFFLVLNYHYGAAQCSNCL